MHPTDDDGPLSLGKTAPGPAPALISGGDLPAGYIVGEYRVEQVIGRGGMGVVYSGLQPVIEKRVAIKVLNAELSADPALVRRFLDEARAVNRIRHPNIIDIFSFGQLADSRQYFVMEYLEGHTLADRLQSADLPGTELPPLLGQICDALDAAHAEHIVHRDLKPENIWIVEPRRGRPFVKLLDFGIAKLLATGEPHTTQAGMLMGTPHYMSPEQCYGQAVDHRTDLYALGVILYQTYTGRLPFQGEVFAEILAKQLTLVPDRPATIVPIPAALDDLIMRCLAKDPADRPSSARVLGEELAGIAVPRIAPSVPPTRAPATTTTLRSAAQSSESVAPTGPASRRRWAFLIGALAVGAIGAIGTTQLMGRPKPAAPSAAVSQPMAIATKVAPAPPTAPDAGAPTAIVQSGEPVPEADLKVPVPAGNKRPGGPVKPVGRESPPKSGATRSSSSGLVTDNPFR